MSRYNRPNKSTNKDYAIRAVFGIVVVAILAILCPRDNSVKLHYNLGEPWNDNEIIAKDSFDIYKSENVIAKELDSMKRYYEPYYELEKEIGSRQIARFEHYFDSLNNESKQEPLPRHVKQYFVKFLQQKYANGILADSSYNNLHDQEIRHIHLFSDNMSQTVSAGQLPSEKMVYEEAMNQDEQMRSILLKLKINNFIHSNLTYDYGKSMDQQIQINSMVTEFAGRVMVGEKIVDKGQIVSQAIYDKLASYEKHEKERTKSKAELTSQFGGQLLYIVLLIVALFIFFYQFRNDYLNSLRHALLVTMLCLFFPILTYELCKHTNFSPYIIPYCILPIFIRVFMDSRTAFITHLITILLCAIAIEQPFEFVVVQTLAGLTAIYGLKELQQRSDLFKAVLFVILTSLLTHLCIDLIHMNFFKTKGVDGMVYLGISFGGFLIFLSYLLLFPIEKLFKFTSNVTLVELSNINNALLRELSEQAPGTFQHSMQVANLSAEVANALGAKAQLVRTGALYHDIGKLDNPVFFTENQSGTNPHDNIPFEDSAQIIIQHVKYGLELANKHNLPQTIKDFIATHHGRSKTKFFYISYKNQNPNREVNEEIFTYPGPNPATLEQAILMMADAVEAASRSLSEYTEESISTLVDRIIDSQVKEGYFNVCPITFENIDTAKKIFKERLKSIYHTRISYPELKK